MELINAKNLSIGYDQELQSGLNFALQQGEVMLITGANGSGKSTLLKTLTKQLPVKQGQVEYLKRSLHIEALPQLISYELPLSVTLGEIVETFGVSAEEFDFFEVGLFQKRWNESSGGERQKALILTRLAQDCDILILDEPFNHVDKKSVTGLVEFLEKLLLKKRVGALVIVSHLLPAFSGDVLVKELKLQ